VLRQIEGASLGTSLNSLMPKNHKILEIKNIKRCLLTNQSRQKANWSCLKADIIYSKTTQSVTERKKQSRHKPHVREREKTANAARLQKLRAESVQYRDNEKSCRKQDRTDPKYQQAEKLRQKQRCLPTLPNPISPNPISLTPISPNPVSPYPISRIGSGRVGLVGSGEVKPVGRSGRIASYRVTKGRVWESGTGLGWVGWGGGAAHPTIP
jgi:hypothetical protein